MILLRDEGFTFDDILLVPQYSEIESRSDVDLSQELLEGLTLKVPIIAANMDTICEVEMVKAMQEAGGLGILHRYASKDLQIEWFKQLKDYTIVPSVGVSKEDINFAREVFPKFGIKHICIDVAHGHQKKTVEAISYLRKDFKIIVGNVATDSAWISLMNAGASVVKVGIGPGAVCTTRVVTGHGVPQAYAIYNIIQSNPVVDPEEITIIADGGLKNSGDIAKAMALGAKFVMTGSLLKGTDCVPSRGLKVYRGMASANAQIEARGKIHNDAAEGVSMNIYEHKSTKEVVKELVGGLRSACTYSGAKNLVEFRQKAVIMKVTGNTVNENKPHGIK